MSKLLVLTIVLGLVTGTGQGVEPSTCGPDWNDDGYVDDDDLSLVLSNWGWYCSDDGRLRPQHPCPNCTVEPYWIRLDDEALGYLLSNWTGSPAGAAADARPGDANRDGLVDDDDLSLVLSTWNRLALHLWFPPVYWEDGDFNGDNIVDDDDLSLLLSNWTGSAPVPEPITLSPLALGALAVLRRRRRQQPAT